MKVFKNKKVVALVVVAIVGTIIFWKRDWIKRKLGISKDIVNNNNQPAATNTPSPSGQGVVYSPCTKPPYKIGCSGKHIKAIQNKLNTKHNAGLIVDGYFGPKTEQAVVNAGYGKELDVKEALELIKS